MCFCNFQHVDFDACRHIAAGDYNHYTDIQCLAGNEFLSSTPGIYAVIQSLTSPLQAVPNSKIIQKGNREMAADGVTNQFRLVSVETIVASAFIVDNIGN